MRKFILFTILMVFLGGVVTSCRKDDDKKIEIKNQLLGKWYPVKRIVNGETYPYRNTSTCGKDYIDFDTRTITYVTFENCVKNVEAASYTTIDDVITITSNTGETRSGTFSIDGKTLSLSANYDYDESGKIDHVVEVYKK